MSINLDPDQLILAARIIKENLEWEWQNWDVWHPSLKEQLADIFRAGYTIRIKPLSHITPGDGRELHNPANLTPEQVQLGATEPMRLLLPEEVGNHISCKLQVWTNAEWRDNAAGGFISFTYRIPASIPFPPLDKWAEVKAAWKAGKVIQGRRSVDGAWKKWADIPPSESPLWNDPKCEFALKPWSLPDPPAGRAWHRAAEWEETDLPEGWMPCFEGEIMEFGDSVRSDDRDDWKLVSAFSGKSISLFTGWFARTLRPRLPAPPEYGPLEACDIPPGSYVYPEGKPKEWILFVRAPQCQGFNNVLGDFVSFATAMRDNWQIIRHGQQAAPCRKEKG